MPEDNSMRRVRRWYGQLQFTEITSAENYNSNPIWEKGPPHGKQNFEKKSEM